jgi:energy-converting hydrogenase Eha subunit C
MIAKSLFDEKLNGSKMIWLIGFGIFTALFIAFFHVMAILMITILSLFILGNYIPSVFLGVCILYNLSRPIVIILLILSYFIIKYWKTRRSRGKS